MLDLLISGGSLVDGTGAPAIHADIGIRGGRIVAVGQNDESSYRSIEADGLVVAPGFVDIHTHYDVQVFWDHTLSPSPLHGVTTVVGGNCGFSVAPLTTVDRDYLMQMLARVEGMPLDAVQRGAPWDWQSTSEYLDGLEGTLTPNAGFLIGHSAIRRAVMHDDAIGRLATSDQIYAMQDLLRQSLAAGGLGFSSTWSPTHNDHNGDPVPSRHADRNELLALCAVVGEFPGTTLEFIPDIAPFDDISFDLMAAMSRCARRPLNWNVLQVYAQNAEVVDHQLSGSDYAASRGGEVIALTLPDSFRTWLNFRTGFLLDLLPGWGDLMGLPDDEKLVMLADPLGRTKMDQLAQSAPESTRNLAHWGKYSLAETVSEKYRPFVGQPLEGIAKTLRSDPWNTLADILLADGLKTVIASPDRGQSALSWARRVDVWRDPRAVVGASDAGAHLDMIDSFSYCTTLIARAVHEQGLLSIEEAVHLLTEIPAKLYGLRDRGRIQEGWIADLVVFDPDSVGPRPIETRYDLPGGAGRIYGGADGIEHVIVGGVEATCRGEFTGSQSGRVLRSGRDTDTDMQMTRGAKPHF
jgi:N-acyl-D-aspartate/D-glutamate deacylase